MIKDTNHQKWVKTKTSDVMLDLADIAEGAEVSMEEMLRYMRGRAFGMVMVLMAVLSMIPNLFGHAILTGLLLFVLGLQMALGFSHLRLPKKALALSFSREKIKKVMDITAPKIARIEKLLKPRLIFITEDIGRRIIGTIVLPLSLLIMVPFPFTNFWPALSVLVLALGLIEKDGVFVLIGGLMSLSAIVLVNEIIEKVLT